MQIINFKQKQNLLSIISNFEELLMNIKDKNNYIYHTSDFVAVLDELSKFYFYLRDMTLKKIESHFLLDLFDRLIELAFFVKNIDPNLGNPHQLLSGFRDEMFKRENTLLEQTETNEVILDYSINHFITQPLIITGIRNPQNYDVRSPDSTSSQNMLNPYYVHQFAFFKPLHAEDKRMINALDRYFDKPHL